MFHEVEWEYLMNVLINGGYETVVHYNEDEEDENYDDNCVLCPNCGEFVYEDDYPTVPMSSECIRCPICDAEFYF